MAYPDRTLACWGFHDPASPFVECTPPLIIVMSPRLSFSCRNSIPNLSELDRLPCWLQPTRQQLMYHVTVNATTYEQRCLMNHLL